VCCTIGLPLKDTITPLAKKLAIPYTLFIIPLVPLISMTIILTTYHTNPMLVLSGHVLAFIPAACDFFKTRYFPSSSILSGIIEAQG
jgi:hypothetical protein